jgi:hypothetical protein
MRRNTSYADYLTDWQHLLATVNALPELASSQYKAKLETILSQIGPVTTRQAQLQAAKQEATQELQKLIAEGKDAARDLMVETKAHFGSRSEQLVQFRVRPLRERRNAKPGAPETPPPTDGSTSEVPAPVTGTQPTTQA